jgi:hypothetical protein
MSITITLKPEEWNVVLGALGEAPFRVAQPVIQSIHKQAQEQAPVPAPAHASAGNGAHHEQEPMRDLFRQ